LKIKLKGRHFDTIAVIEAGLQAVLNTFTEDDFRDAFKKMAEALGMVHTCRRELL
jgi:predicted helicase